MRKALRRRDKAGLTVLGLPPAKWILPPFGPLSPTLRMATVGWSLSQTGNFYLMVPIFLSSMMKLKN